MAGAPPMGARRLLFVAILEKPSEKVIALNTPSEILFVRLWKWIGITILVFIALTEPWLALAGLLVVFAANTVISALAIRQLFKVRS